MNSPRATPAAWYSINWNQLSAAYSNKALVRFMPSPLVILVDFTQLPALLSQSRRQWMPAPARFAPEFERRERTGERG